MKNMVTFIPKAVFTLFLTASISLNSLASAPQSYASAVKKASPSVVSIVTASVQRVNSPYDYNPFTGRQQPQQQLASSLGSGVIVDKRGYILTNNHVVKTAAAIEVALADGRKARATVVGKDPETDLAVLKVSLSNLTPITLADSSKAEVGEVILAIGNPFGLGGSVTLGIISALGRDHLGINQFENFIQIDAAINPGNSGGALVDTNGHLLGINTAIFSKSGGYQGIGFAIPINLAEKVMHQIIANGHVTRGWLGIGVNDLHPTLAKSLRIKGSGVVVVSVMRDSPAYFGGLSVGDVLTAVNGQKIKSTQQFMKIIAGLKPNSKVSLNILRQNKHILVKVKIKARPKPPTQAQAMMPNHQIMPGRQGLYGRY